MTLLRPEFLWALLTLSIPIVIHLFNFRKKRVVYFSNTRFIKQIKEETTALKRIKQYLILAARILFLSFLVLAFAQPFIPADKQLNAGSPVVLYIDNSYSMTLQNGNATLLEQAVNYAQDLIDAFPAETRFVLLTNSNQAFLKKSKTKKEVSDYLTQIKPELENKSFERIVNKDWRQTDAFFVLSDFQQQQFENIKVDSFPFVLVPFQKENTSNLFFDSVYLQNPFLVKGEKNKLVCVLHNSGVDKRSQVLVRFFIEEIQVGSVTTDIQPNKNNEIVFDLPMNLSGWQRGRVSVNDAGNAFDNDFYLAFDFSTKVNVVEIKSSKALNYIDKVFANNQLFQFKSFKEGNMNYESAENADLLILNELNALSPSLQNVIDKNLKEGGSIFVIPSESADWNSFQSIMPQVKSVTTTSNIAINKIDFDHPFFKNVFETRQDNIELPTSKPIINWNDNGETLIKLVNDQPFLSTINRTGKVFIVSSPLRLPFTNFATNALFVPVMYKMAVTGLKNTKSIYMQSNLVFVKSKDNLKLESKPLKLKGNTEVIPEQRLINNQVMLNVEGVNLAPSHYWVMQEKDTIDLVAKNLESKESYLQYIKKDELLKRFGVNATILDTNDSSKPAIKNIVDENYKGKPLWKLALIISILFLLAEIALIRLML
jgi:hypothetical protein